MNTEERMIGASRVADILGISESYPDLLEIIQTITQIVDNLYIK